MGELALIEPSAINVATELPQIFTLAKALKQAHGFLPQHLQTEGQIVAVVLAGRELGIQPMAAIRGIKLVKGAVTLDASLQLALMVRAGARVQWLKDGQDGEAVLVLSRPGQEPYTSRFTLEMAKRAGLTGDNWNKHPAAMLRARCVTAAGKAYMPDVLAGVYLPDELDDAHAAPAPVQVVEARQVERVEAVQAQEAHEVPALPVVSSAELAAEAIAALASARTVAELAAIEDGIRGEWPKYGRTDRAKLKAAQSAARQRVESANAEWGMGEQPAETPAEGE